MVEVMIIRPEQEVGMGCCGGICSDRDGLIHMQDEFKHHEDDREALGKLYQETEREYGDLVQITFLDPRNVLAIFLYFLKQVKERHLSLIKAGKYILFHMKYNAIFINGKLVEDHEAYKRKLQAEAGG
ncbi:hypothetical protein [Halobacillus sp. K22]|uniref:hypothetical protein n=1 Tax=Halobacillus sp. K22 TaxID=3457431 RepID=UPI003FCCCE00